MCRSMEERQEGYIYIYIPWANVKKRGLKNKDRGNKNNSLHIENL